MKRALFFRAAALALFGMGSSASADTTQAAHQARKHRTRPAHHQAGTGRATTLIPRPAAAPAPADHTETVIVHGQKRFQTAPMPNLEIHDPADALRDPSTGAPIGKFGGAYIDANPVPPINPGLKGDQSPVSEGIQH